MANASVHATPMRSLGGLWRGGPAFRRGLPQGPLHRAATAGRASSTQREKLGPVTPQPRERHGARKAAVPLGPRHENTKSGWPIRAARIPTSTIWSPPPHHHAGRDVGVIVSPT